MSNIPVGVTIGSQSLESFLRDHFAGKTPTVEEVAPVAMKHCRDETHAFMCATDDEQFKTGVGALLLFFKDDHEVRERITHEMKMLGALSAAMTGVPVDWIALATDDAPKAIGLMGLYRAEKSR